MGQAEKKGRKADPGVALKLAELATRAFAAVSEPHPPTTMADLAERLGVAPNHELARALDLPKFKSKGAYCFVPTVAKGKALSAVPEAPVYLTSQLDRPEVLGHILEFTLSHAKNSTDHAFSAAELEKKIRGSAGALVRKALEQRLRNGALPPRLGAIRRKTTVVFRLEDLVTGSAPARAPRSEIGRSQFETEPVVRRELKPDFRTQFDAAFERLDQEGRNLNFVKLLALRKALPQFERASFDEGLRQLRIEGRYDLNSSEGTHGQLTDEERQAGIVEAGSRLVYCQRIAR